MNFTPRERVLCALNHEEPDRVPLFIGTSGATTVLGPGYDKLREHLGIGGGQPRWISKPFQYTWLDEEVMVRLGSDGRPIAPGPAESVFREEISPDCMVDVLVIGDDLGMTAGPMISPNTYRRLIKLHHAEFLGAIKQRMSGKIFFHSCGNIYPLLGDLADVGVDLLNPVQVSAGAMGDTAKLKKEYGRRLSFCGAIDTQRVMPHGTPDEVRKEVRRRIKDLAPGGGYLAAAVHCIQPDVPPENIVAMCEEAAVAGRYPLQL